MSICASDVTAWVQPPNRLRLDPVTHEPIGVGETAVWDPSIQFRGQKVRTRFNNEVLTALLKDHPGAV